MRRNLEPFTHPAWIVSGSQLDKVIKDMEAGKIPLPDDGPVDRDDLDPETRARLFRATGGQS